MAVLFKFTPEYDVAEDECNEFGNVTRVYASAYSRTRRHLSRLNVGERRCLVADFNGVLHLGVSIADAQWSGDGSQAASLSDQKFSGRAAQATVTAGTWGVSQFACTVTLANGEIYIQKFEVRVE